MSSAMVDLPVAKGIGARSLGLEITRPMRSNALDTGLMLKQALHRTAEIERNDVTTFSVELVLTTLRDMKLATSLTLWSLLSASSVAYCGEPLDALRQWPHWRGPLATGAAPFGDPPVRWDEKTNVKWKAPLPGRGSATPIVWGDCLFVSAAVDTGRAAKAEDIPKVDDKLERKTEAPTTYHRFLLLCFDRNTGKLRWQRVCAERVPHEGIQPTHSYAAGSPATDGKHVWVSFGSQGVYCYDFSGELKWKRDDLPRMHTRLGWGEASTPVVHADALILNWDQEVGSRLIVLDAATGQARWQIDRDEPTTWHTPLVVRHDGVTQVITNGTNRMRGYDFNTRQLLWECGGGTINAIPSPVAADGVAFLMSGYGRSIAIAVPLGARGDLTDSDKLAWRQTRGTPYVPSPLLVDKKLYFTQANSNLLICLDAKTGRPYFERERLEACSSFYGSPVAAAGRIYLTDRAGVTVVLKQSPQLEVLATNRLDDRIDASPAVVGRQLFLRGHEHLYCLE
jgi:outer membrane protein assembly factor BamB